MVRQICLSGFELLHSPHAAAEQDQFLPAMNDNLFEGASSNDLKIRRPGLNRNCGWGPNSARGLVWWQAQGPLNQLPRLGQVLDLRGLALKEHLSAQADRENRWHLVPNAEPEADGSFGFTP